MYLIRKVSPWQTAFSSDNFCYSIGNPTVFAFEEEEEALGKKIDLELEAVSMNPIPNFYEYWDVDASKELIELNHFLVKNYEFSILTTNDKKIGDEVDMNEIIHGIYFDDRFSEVDILKIQVFVGRYYYKIQEISDIGKYILVVDIYSPGNFLQDAEFKVYDTKEAAQAVLEQYPDDLIEIQKITK